MKEDKLSGNGLRFRVKFKGHQRDGLVCNLSKDLIDADWKKAAIEGFTKALDELERDIEGKS